MKIFLLFLSLIFAFIYLANSKPKKEILYSKNAPNPIGPYSQAIKYGDFLFISGQIAINPETNEMVVGNIEDETRQVMENIKAIIIDAKFKMENILKTTIFLTDLNDFEVVNKIYSEYFKGAYPARETVQVSKLPRGAKVEISVIVGK